jgi:hypothetical protein
MFFEASYPTYSPHGALQDLFRSKLACKHNPTSNGTLDKDKKAGLIMNSAHQEKKYVSLVITLSGLNNNLSCFE